MKEKIINILNKYYGTMTTEVAEDIIYQLRLTKETFQLHIRSILNDIDREEIDATDNITLSEEIGTRLFNKISNGVKVLEAKDNAINTIDNYIKQLQDIKHILIINNQLKDLLK